MHSFFLERAFTTSYPKLGKYWVETLFNGTKYLSILENLQLSRASGCCHRCMAIVINSVISHYEILPIETCRS